MKILQINKLYYPIIGGVETTTQVIAEGLNNQDNLTVDVLVCQLKGPRKIEKINGIKIYRAASWGKLLGMPLSLDFFKLFRQLYRQYDLILIHHPFPLIFLVFPFIKKTRIIIYYHSNIVRQKISKLFFLPFIKLGLKQAEKILVGGQNLITYSPLLKRYQNKCVIIPFSLDLENYLITPQIQEEAQKIKQQYPGPLILSVGRLVYYKGFKYLITAIKEIQAHLIIIGQGPEKKKLAGLIKKHNLNHKVYLINHVPNLKPFYVACDLFVLPACAPSEAFGLVQLEAMAFAKPVINTNLPTAVPEVSLDQKTGLTVPIKNSLALAGAINKIINNQQLKNQLGQTAVDRVCRIFNRKTFLKKLKENLS